MNAPKRIWTFGSDWSDDPSISRYATHGPYLLDTTEALAESEMVQRMIRDAKARGMERAAKEARETDYPWASPTNEQADACDQMAERIADWLERCAAAIRKGEPT